MIPATLDGWTLPTIQLLLQQGVFESDLFDFKEQLPRPTDGTGKVRLARTCAAFANSAGGFLIFGVHDDRSLPAPERLVGLDPAEDFPERFGNYPASAEPSVEWTPKSPPISLPSGRLLHVVNIPASARKPHGSLEDGRWSFCKRTSKGTELMSYEEIHGLFVDASRRRSELAWLRSKVEKIGELQRTLNIESQHGRWNLDMLLSRFDAGPLEPVILSLFDLIGDQPSLVSDLNELVDSCRKVDAALQSAATFAMQPRDRSYSRSGLGPLESIHEHTLLLRINGAAHRALEALTRLRA